MNKNITVIQGDGIGPEITNEAIKVLNAISEIKGHKFNYLFADMGGVAYDKATANISENEKKEIDQWDDDAKRNLTLPQKTLDAMDHARDTGGAVLFGSVGRSDLPKRTAELALLGMRERYGVVNKRPFIIDPILAHNSILFRDPIKIEGFEIVSPEESLFNGATEKGENFHSTRKQFTREKLVKTVTDAFEKAKQTGKKILCVSKYNVLVSEKMLSDVFEEISQKYEGEVELNSWSQNGQLIIDNAGMQIAANPQRYQNTIVIVDAMFGDFLQAIVDVVSGTVRVNEKALEQIKQNGINRTFIRELCGGLYFGERMSTHEVAFDTLTYDRKTLENLASVAQKENEKLGLPCVHSLVIEGVETFDYWKQVLDEHAKENGYEIKHLGIKEGVEMLLTNPLALGTIIASNMIGDIYTDLAAAVVGKSLGIMPSSAVNSDGFGIYEQIAGSAPDIAGQNKANPIAEIRSAAMMLEDFGDKDGAKRIYDAIEKVIKKYRTQDIMEEGYIQVSTTEMGDLIAKYIKGKTGISENTLYNKVWEKHKVGILPTGQTQLFVGRHLMHEVTSPQAFEMLREKKMEAKYPELTTGIVDHVIPTDDTSRPFADNQAELMTRTMEKNTEEFKIEFFSATSGKQGVCHVSFPEQGLIWPGIVAVCGDSHTCTYGAFGSLAFGIGTTQVSHVLATQTLAMDPLKVRRIKFNGTLNLGVTAKDLALYMISELGVEGGLGFAYEFGGDIVDKMSMEERMTLCNMAVEGGARLGYINPDQTTFDYLKGKPFAPKDFDKAIQYWKSIVSDSDAVYDDEVVFDVSKINPMVTWGVNPSQAIAIESSIPILNNQKEKTEADDALEYMGINPGDSIEGTQIDVVFIGSCTNGRLSDFEAAAKILKGKKVVVKTLIVPGSQKVKEQAEKLGLDIIFKEAGAEWREAGCSMCLAMNPDKLIGNQRCASTSNRNFKGRQGSPTGRTHLMSPYTAAASAIEGKIADPRNYLKETADKLLIPENQIIKIIGRGIPKPANDQNTDDIVPARYLKEITFANMGEYVYFDERVKEGESHPFNDSKYQGARILVGGANYGCGSSREHAPQALHRYGIKVIIAPSFAEIFAGNCASLGIVGIIVSQQDATELADFVKQNPSIEIIINLADKIISYGSKSITFDMPEGRRQAFLNGTWDAMTILQQTETEVEKVIQRLNYVHS